MKLPAYRPSIGYLRPPLHVTAAAESDRERLVVVVIEWPQRHVFRAGNSKSQAFWTGFPTFSQGNDRRPRRSSIPREVVENSWLRALVWNDSMEAT